MSYSIKEIYFTVQGEGFQTGKNAIFCRFSGCNLWTGREQDRSKATCTFCDTDFFGTDGENGAKYPSCHDLIAKIEECWPKELDEKFVVFTGGEPLLQLDQLLIDELHKKGFKIAIETNGTMLPPKNVDWICVSPKKNAKLVLLEGDELKLVCPQLDFPPEQFEDLNFKHFYVQPMDGKELQKNILECVAYCVENPLWKLSLQTHKIIGIK